MKRLTFRSVAIRIWLICAIICSGILTGCTTYLVPMNYAPSSVKTATGALTVSEFKYIPSEPAETKPIRSNQIKSTAIGGDILIDRDVKVFVRDAVFAELRAIGVKTNDSSKVLSGAIEAFLVDNIGFSLDIGIRIRYSLTDTLTKKVVFQSVKNTQYKTAAYAGNPFSAALNTALKINIEQLLDDTEFMKTIN